MNITKIGCEAYIVRENKLLMGKRGNVYGSGSWALPGGHLEFMENSNVCLARELKEEMDLDLDPKTFELIALTDNLNRVEGLHYIHITFKVNIGTQEPKLMEPEACQEWQWFDIDNLPENIFVPHQGILKTIFQNQIYLG